LKNQLQQLLEKSSDKWGYIKTDGSDLFPTNNFRYAGAGNFSKVE